jgi:hypothetical protein
VIAGAAAALLAGASGQALAQSATPGSAIVLDPIVITGESGVEGSTLSQRVASRWSSARR